ncbi:fatty acid desaturase family protein [Bradyrhizobium sp. SZCCHNRI20481]|uniref:fatty acid desaturase family protein n=1 Tax=Bradyrhizobium sp. SZCCHNRI20481 TaxID=3057286 RepID=UPI002916346E|nr:fatty acid desaturase [Bradyrhizobium sp. SZCCHNRI20481]
MNPAFGKTGPLRTPIPSPSRTLARTAVILAAYAVLASAALAVVPSAWAALPVLGCAFILSGFLNAGHDCVHSTHFGAAWWDRIAGAVWCTLILVNFTIYRRQHLVHHRFPATAGDSEEHVQFASLHSYLYAQSGVGFWMSIFRRIVRTWQGELPASINSPLWARAARIDNLVISLWLATCGAATLWQTRAMFIAYWLPLLLYPAFVLFFSLAEHFDLADEQMPWPRARNVRSNAVVRFFQWHANYHAVHHRRPALPAFALQSAHGADTERVDPLETSYLAFHFRLARRLVLSAPV